MTRAFAACVGRTWVRLRRTQVMDRRLRPVSPAHLAVESELMLMGEAADAVELALEDPVWVGEGLVPEDGLHRLVAVQRFLLSTARCSCDLFMRERPSTLSRFASL